MAGSAQNKGRDVVTRGCIIVVRSLFILKRRISFSSDLSEFDWDARHGLQYMAKFQYLEDRWCPECGWPMKRDPYDMTRPLDRREWGCPVCEYVRDTREGRELCKDVRSTVSSYRLESSG